MPTHNKLTHTELITQFTEKHGNTYNYSLVKYVNGKLKVDIICNIHGIFPQTPYHHKRGIGCPKCGGTKLLSTIEVIQDFEQVHGKKFNYTNVVYVNSKLKVKIICNKCNTPFEQTPNDHKSGAGCANCSYNNKTCRSIETYRNRKTTLYYIKVNDVYKIGLTLETVKNRYSSDIKKGIDIDIIQEWFFEDGAKAYILKKLIIDKMYNYKYHYSNKILRGGNTELFKEDIIDKIIPLIES